MSLGLGIIVCRSNPRFNGTPAAVCVTKRSRGWHRPVTTSGEGSAMFSPELGGGRYEHPEIRE